MYNVRCFLPLFFSVYLTFFCLFSTLALGIQTNPNWRWFHYAQKIGWMHYLPARIHQTQKKHAMPCHANKQQKMKKTTAAPAVTTTTETMRFLDTEKPEYQCENPNHDTTRFKCTVRAICSAESWCSTVKSFADDFCLTTTTTLNCYWWRIDKVVHMESGSSITNVKHFKISLLHFLCLCFFSTFPSSLKLKFCRIFASHSRQVTCIKCSFFRYTLFFHQVFYTCFVLFIQLLASQ